MRGSHSRAFVAVALLSLSAAVAASLDASAREPVRAPDIHYVPTPYEVVDKMLEVAKVTKTDVVYDLGCGDGRIVIAAAKKYGAKGVGYDIDPRRVAEARANVQAAGVGHLVQIQEADVFTLDLRGASVVMLYLLPALNVKLIPQLERLSAGSRVVSHDFDMAGVTPAVKIEMSAPDVSGNGTRVHRIYGWVLPFNAQRPMP